MRRITARLSVIHLAVAIWVATPLAMVLSTNARAEETVASASVWYVPVEEDFRAEYDRDLANQSKQTWDDYWGWVVAFYKGNFLATGWDERAKKAVTCVETEENRRIIRFKLNSVGRELCREWAKDSSVRKINSSDLLHWGKQLEKAREKDRGQGEELTKELERIHDEVKRKTRG